MLSFTFHINFNPTLWDSHHVVLKLAVHMTLMRGGVDWCAHSFFRSIGVSTSLKSSCLGEMKALI